MHELEKIVYFMDNYSDFGGAANTLLRQAVLTKKAGKKVLVVVSARGNVCEDYLRICARGDLPVHELCFSVTNQPEGIDLLSVFEDYDGIESFLKEHEPDIVHSVQLNPVVELACRELEIPHIMNIYQALPAFFRFGYADIFPRYHLCDSLYYSNFWNKYLGTASCCVRTVADRVKRKSEYFMDNKSVNFVCIGQLCERKNQLEVIKAFKIAVQEYGVCGRIHFYGRMETLYTELCMRYIRDNGMQKYTQIKGFSENMEEVYLDNDVLICGSISESYPNVISEALSYGLIVISTPVAGVPEVITDRENGYLCKGYKAKDIADSIQEFSNDATMGKLTGVRKNAYVTYERVHSPESVTLSLLECYREILYGYKPKNDYTINTLNKEFGGFINKFYQHRDCFTCVDYIRVNLWKIYYVIQRLGKMSAEGSCYIWGTGKYGRVYKEILDIFAPDAAIAGYIDSYAKGQYMGYRVTSPDKVLCNGSNIILVGIFTKREEVFAILNQNHFEYNANYFTFDSYTW